MRWRLAKELDLISQSNRELLHYKISLTNKIKKIANSNKETDNKLKEIKGLLKVSEIEFEDLILSGLCRE